jgi:hypothetical protein
MWHQKEIPHTASDSWLKAVTTALEVNLPYLRLMLAGNVALPSPNPLSRSFIEQM